MLGSGEQFSSVEIFKNLFKNVALNHCFLYINYNRRSKEDVPAAKF